MTLPFRRRHHDDDTSHDRARSLLSSGLLEPLVGDDATWLESHLRNCPQCRAEGEAYAADRALLRSLRDAPIEPPRDLWVHTRAAIEGEARSRRRPGAAHGFGGRLPGLGVATAAARRQVILPLGLVAGAMVALIVVATAFVPSPTPGTAVIPTQRASSDVAVGTPFPTGLQVAAVNPVGWAQANADGTYSLHFANISEVCLETRPDCAELGDEATSPLKLAGRPQSLVQSPNSGQVAIVSSSDGSEGSVVIAPITTPAASGSPSPTPTATATATPTATPTSAPATSPASSPASPPATPPRSSSSPVATVAPSPDGTRTIIRGVRVVGQPGYSPDGAWFAFSARPLGGRTGPDLYVWHSGDAEARKLTTDGATFFSGWVGQRVLASRVEMITNQDATGSPATSPSAAATTSTAAQSVAPSAAPSTAPDEAHPVSFLVDPATAERDELALRDIWMPTVDETGTFVTYWSGTVRPSEGGTWAPATGRLVLDAWTAPVAASSSTPSAAPTTAATPPTSNGPTTPGATSSAGPAGMPFELAAGPLADFETRFDLDGNHLAVWTADVAGVNVGQLRLLVLDPATRTVVDANPLSKEPALRGFSLEQGRLGWVQPPGQNGEQSTVKVLAWTGRTFGKVEAAPGGQLVIIR